MELMNNIQIIIQTEKNSGGYLCEGYSGFPVINPYFIAIASSGSHESHQNAKKLRLELTQTILNLSGNAKYSEAPCGGYAESLWKCHAHRVSECKKILLLVGDSTTVLPDNFDLKEWSERTSFSNNYHILPIYQKGANVQNLLPPSIRPFNAVFWINSISEIVPDILTAAGVTANDFRIFISYLRTETQDLAEQLFDALSHKNFDVYLDRFRTPPGINFQIRLTQELADKSMVLILESPSILNSKWIRFEIEKAKAYRLGIFALNVPGGANIPDIGQDERLELKDRDFKDLKKFLLSDDLLDLVVGRIKQEHDKMLIRRREFIRNTMRDSLLYEKVNHFKVDPNGLVRAQSNVNGKRYAIWLTTRPADISDFQITHMHCKPPESGVIIGPEMHELTRKAQAEWLANVCEIKNFDEGKIKEIVKMIGEGK